MSNLDIYEYQGGQQPVIGVYYAQPVRMESEEYKRLYSNAAKPNMFQQGIAMQASPQIYLSQQSQPIASELWSSSSLNPEASFRKSFVQRSIPSVPYNPYSQQYQPQQAQHYVPMQFTQQVLTEKPLNTSNIARFSPMPMPRKASPQALDQYEEQAFKENFILAPENEVSGPEPYEMFTQEEKDKMALTGFKNFMLRKKALQTRGNTGYSYTPNEPSTPSEMEPSLAEELLPMEAIFNIPSNLPQYPPEAPSNDAKP